MTNTMAEVEFEFGKASSSLICPPVSVSGSGARSGQSSNTMRGPVVSKGTESDTPLGSGEKCESEGHVEPMDDIEESNVIGSGQDDHDLDAVDSCVSEDEESSRPGRLEIVLNEKSTNNDRHRNTQQSLLSHRSGHGQQSNTASSTSIQGHQLAPLLSQTQHQVLSDVDEEDEPDDEDEQRRAAFQLHRKQLQHQLREPFGNLTVTKYPINNGQQHFLGRHGGHYEPNFSNNALKQTVGGGNGRSRQTSLLEQQQFQFLSSSPQTSPNTDPFNNNNNNSITLNNNKEGMVKGQLHNNVTQTLKEHHHLSDQRHGQPQRRNHHGHFVNSHPHHQTHGHETSVYGPTHGIKAERKSAGSNGSPNISDLKSDSFGPGGGGGLNLLSRSIGNALLNLASLGSLASLQHHQHQTQVALDTASPTGNSNSSLTSPLNLTSSGGLNGVSAGLANSYLAQYMSQQGGHLSPSPSTFPSTHPNNLPQLILASGNIVQGIQGAQLLIPSSQGLMTQTVLTIPITQPQSPSSLLSNSPGSSNSPSSSKKTHHSHHGNHHGKSTSPTAHRPTRSPSPNSTDFSSPQPPTTLMGSTHNNIPLISEKLGGLDRSLNPMGLQSNSGLNGFRMASSQGRRESQNNSSTLISASLNNNQGSSSSHAHHQTGSTGGHGHLHSMSICPPSKHSPCSSHSHDHDDSCDFLDPCSDNEDEQMLEGINLDEIKEFAKAFKLRRLSLGLTQTQVGQALSVTEGPAYSQSAICSALAWQLAQSQSQSNRTSIPHPQQSIFEKLDITPKSAQKIKPVLEKWMKEAEDRYRTGNQNLNEFVGMEPSKKRKRRTSFTPQALEILNTHFERNTHPSGAEITTLAHQLGYEREVIRIWFCNKRQALKNTVRMMSKGGSPI